MEKESVHRLAYFATAAALLRSAYFMQIAFRGDDPKIEAAEKELKRCRKAWEEGKWAVARRRAELATSLIDKIVLGLRPPRVIAYEYTSVLQLARSYIRKAISL